MDAQHEPIVPSQRDGPRRLPQYTLRTLLLWMTAASVLFAIMAVVGAHASTLLVWFLLLVAAHVAANVWGTKVGRRRGGWHDAPGDGPPVAPAARPVTFAPSTRLREGIAIGRAMIVTTCIGAAVGGASGGYLLWSAHPGAVGWIGFVVGILSAAVVGGFLGFLASSFLDVALKALREATCDCDQDADRPKQG